MYVLLFQVIWIFRSNCYLGLYQQHIQPWYISVLNILTPQSDTVEPQLSKPLRTRGGP